LTERGGKAVEGYTYHGSRIFSEQLPCPVSSVLAIDEGFILGSCSILMRVDMKED
jgi:hypothetical protein